MTLIKISDLTTADINLSVSADSFLNELQKADTTQIFGGSKGGGCCYYEKGKDDCWYGGWKKEEYSCEEKEDCDYSYKEESDDKYSWGWKGDC